MAQKGLYRGLGSFVPRKKTYHSLSTVRTLIDFDAAVVVKRICRDALWAAALTVDSGYSGKGASKMLPPSRVGCASWRMAHVQV